MIASIRTVPQTKYKKWLYAGTAAAVLAVASVVAIDYKQSIPLGAALATPDLSFSLPAGMPFDIGPPQLMTLKGQVLLSGAIYDLRKDGDARSLPGADLDALLKSRSETLRQQDRSLAVAGAVSMMQSGFPDLAAESLANHFGRGEKRLYIAQLGAGGQVDVTASLAGRVDYGPKYLLSYFQPPGGAALMLDAGVSPEKATDGQPSLHQGFSSLDSGKTWKFDARLRVPAQFHYASFVSATDAYQLDDAAVSAPKLFISHDQAQSWATVDALKVVWQNEPERDDARYNWQIIPLGAGKAVGWATRWVDERGRSREDDARAKQAARPVVQLETRRFELALSRGVVAVSGVTAVPADSSVEIANAYDIATSPDGAMTWTQNFALRHFDPAAKQWGEPKRPPLFHGSPSQVDEAWVGSGVWVVLSRTNTLLNKINCFIPPFSNNRFCDKRSASNYYVSRDHGQSWTPFALPLTRTAAGERSAEIIGWDSQRQKLLVYRSSYSPKLPTTIEAYSLPR